MRQLFAAPAHVRLAAMAATIVATLGIASLLTAWTGGNGDRWAAFVGELAGSTWPAALWLLAAAGYGLLLTRLVVPERHCVWIETVTLGIAVHLVLDAAAGRLGVLQIGGRLGAIAITVIGIGLLAAHLLRTTRDRRSSLLPDWPTAAASPALAVLAVAACSAPGWLWASEFGGYDALSYHLLLPREWALNGAISGLEHNVYSFLPGYVEAAFHHIMVLHGDPIRAAPACQLLNAAMTLLAAAAIGRAAGVLFDTRTGGLAVPIALGTPWLLITGSLAYNDVVPVLMLAAALAIVGDTAPLPGRAAVLLGLLAAAACGAKLTSIGTVAAPIALVAALCVAVRRLPAALVVGAAVMAAALGPWLIGNGLATGNPVFPFATDLLGRGHWTAEQAATWRAGHGGGAGLTERLAEGWRQLMRYGIGANPDPDEPWKPQWSVLPAAGLLCIVIGLARRRGERAWLTLLIVFVVQLLFWLTMTHVKSRFMLPALVPMAASAAAGLAGLRGLQPRAVGAVVTAVLLLIWCTVPAAIFHGERDGAPSAMVGLTGVRRGDGLSAEQVQQLSATAPELFIRTQLPADARVLLVGDATPFFHRNDVIYQTTWDRGPMSAALRSGSGPSAWIETLRSDGITHVLVDPAMLRRWEASSWNDPLLTADRVIDALDTESRLVRVFGHVRLYAID